LATEDHNTPTENILLPIADPVSRLQVDTLRKNAAEFGIRIHSLGDKDPGSSTSSARSWASPSRA
jgi:3-isopropylmalate/(R)-2-methylmalate dehydratase large subunit